MADDTNIIYSGADIQNLVRKANDDLKNVNKWFSCNKLSLNVIKTEYVISANKSKLKVNSLENFWNFCI